MRTRKRGLRRMFNAEKKYRSVASSLTLKKKTFTWPFFYQSSITPSFITNASHSLERDYERAAAQTRSNGTRPIVVAFYHGTFPIIPGLVMLPLGIVYE
jgi:hypothetical protein